MALLGLVLSALVVFALSRLLTPRPSHRDMVHQMRSRAFGNRWSQALELSKLIATSSIPRKEIPELIGDLSELYDSSTDARAQNFIVTALGALNHPDAIPTLSKALGNGDARVQFQAVAALAQMGRGPDYGLVSRPGTSGFSPTRALSTGPSWPWPPTGLPRPAWP